MSNEEIKKDWYKIDNITLQRTISHCQTIIDSSRYSDDVIKLVTDTQKMLLGILKDRNLLV